MRRDHQVTDDQRSWWFWPTIIIVIAAVVALIVWTLVQMGAVSGGATVGPQSTDRIAAIALRAIARLKG